MKENKKHKGGALIYFLIIIAVIVGMFLWMKMANAADVIPYSQYENERDNKQIQSVEVVQNEEVPTGFIRYRLSSTPNETRVTYVSDVNAEQDFLRKAGVGFTVKDVPGENVFLTSVLPLIIVAVLMFIMMSILMNRMSSSGVGGSLTNFTKNRATMAGPKDNKIRFADVAGMDEEKEELEELVDFLKAPQKYLDLGARIPKGVLLVGAPGTGKTLLAKALAGEAGVPFFSISGSDFVEMFVGVGASRVRELFAEAKRNSPCIIFIDEIDAVARQRGSGLGGGHDEREQTLNQLLVEMDGFSANQGIIVVAATNRVDILDSAILRPGRFDRKVAVGKPDVKGREEILKVHSKNKKLGDDVDLKRTAQVTAGFSGADLENLLNEAAIETAKNNRSFISEKDIEQALVKVGIGKEKKSRVISEKEKRITAYHEMGHAILFEALPEVGPVHTVSIIPTGLGAAGYTMPLPENDEMFWTKGRMLQEIMVAMGGRIAEELKLEDITTGASQDIKQATNIARKMVMEYGMSEKVGFQNVEPGEDQVFMGRDLGHLKTYGADTLNAIESEVKRILDECYRKAKEILKEKDSVLEHGVALLLEKEKINKEEFEAIYYAEN